MPQHSIVGRRAFALAASAVALAAPPFAGRTARAQGTPAAAPQAPGQSPGFYRFKVGGFTVSTLHDGHLRRPAVDRSLVRTAERLEIYSGARSISPPLRGFSAATLTRKDGGWSLGASFRG